MVLYNDMVMIITHIKHFINLFLCECVLMYIVYIILYRYIGIICDFVMADIKVPTFISNFFMATNNSF